MWIRTRNNLLNTDAMCCICVSGNHPDAWSVTAVYHDVPKSWKLNKDSNKYYCEHSAPEYTLFVGDECTAKQVYRAICNAISQGCAIIDI